MVLDGDGNTSVFAAETEVIGFSFPVVPKGAARYEPSRVAS